MDINAYTGTPYSFMQYNCWSHVVKVRKDAGLCTKLFTASNQTALSIAKAFKKGKADLNSGLTQVETPSNFDVILGMKKGCLPHSGVYYDGYVSHCGAGRGAVCVSSFEEFKAMYRDLEIWR